MPDGLANAVHAATGILLAVVGATFCARIVRRGRWLRQPGFRTLLGCGVGLAVIAAGFARYLLTAMPAGIERVESCVAVFIGGLGFAGSVIPFCKLHGALNGPSAGFSGYKVGNLLGLPLLAWLR